MNRRNLIAVALWLAAAVTTIPWLVSSARLIDWLGGQPRWRRRVAVVGEWTGDLRTIRTTLTADQRVFLIGDPAGIETRRILGGAVFHLYPIRTTFFGKPADLHEARFSGALPDGVFLSMEPGRTPTLRRLSDDEIRPWPRSVIPFAADIRGSRAIDYRTRLTLTSTEARPVKLEIRRRGVGSEAKRSRLELAPGKPRAFENALSELFGQPGIAALEIRADGDFVASAQLVAQSGSAERSTPIPTLSDDRFTPGTPFRASLVLATATPFGSWRFWGLNLRDRPAEIAVDWERDGQHGLSKVRLEPAGLALLGAETVADWQGRAATRLRFSGPDGTRVFASRRVEPNLETELNWGLDGEVP